MTVGINPSATIYVWLDAPPDIVSVQWFVEDLFVTDQLPANNERFCPFDAFGTLPDGNLRAGINLSNYTPGAIIFTARMTNTAGEVSETQATIVVFNF